jgi:hypothetical protein
MLKIEEETPHMLKIEEVIHMLKIEEETHILKIEETHMLKIGK